MRTFFSSEARSRFRCDGWSRASAPVTEHRFPAWLRHDDRHERINDRVPAWPNDAAGRAGLEECRKECLAWCHDRLENGKYADQKYLEAWSAWFGAALQVLGHRGVNPAQWTRAGGCRSERAATAFTRARFMPGCAQWWPATSTESDRDDTEQECRGKHCICAHGLLAPLCRWAGATTSSSPR